MCSRKFLDVNFIKCRVNGFCSDRCEKEYNKHNKEGE